MTQTQQELERLRTLQESYNDLVEGIPAISEKIDKIDLTPIENKVEEGVNSLATKINNIDFSNVAKLGDNEDATNTNVKNEFLLQIVLIVFQAFLLLMQDQHHRQLILSQVVIVNQMRYVHLFLGL